MKGTRIWKAVVALPVLATCVIGAYLLETASRAAKQNEAACGEESITARYATGVLDNQLLNEPAQQFSRPGVGCFSASEIQHDYGAHSKYFCGRLPWNQVADPANGIEAAPVFFFVGHGTVDQWQTGSDFTRFACMHLGVSKLRYYLQCSCEVFAHGKWDSQEKYPAPWTFDHGFDEESQRNVFDRWRSALGPGVRMACGLSSEMECSLGQIARAEADKRAFLDVSDSFLEGLHREPGDAPLCLTRDSAFAPDHQPHPRTTPLYDKHFESSARAEHDDDLGGFFYIEYIRDSLSRRRMPWHAPQLQPYFTFAEAQPTAAAIAAGESWLARLGRLSREFMARAIEWLGTANAAFYDPGVELMPVEGDCPDAPQCGKDEIYVKKAVSFLQQHGWDEVAIEKPPEVQRLIIDSYPVNVQPDASVIRFQKGVIVRFYRKLPNIPAAAATDEADAIVVVLNHKGQVASAWKHWRRIVATGHLQITRAAFDRLQRRAQARLPNGGSTYVFRGAQELVYQEQGGQLMPFLRFLADPKNLKDREAVPPKPSLRFDIPIEENAPKID